MNKPLNGASGAAPPGLRPYLTRMRISPQDRRRFEARLGLTGGGGQGGIIRLPGVVTGLLAVIGVVSLVCLLPTGLGHRLEYMLAFVPARTIAQLDQGQSVLGALMPLVGHVFVHGNLGHLALNALGLAVFGSGVARRLATDAADPKARTWNTLLFLSFFLACGVAGGLFFALFNLGSAVMLIGASGAISGVLAAAMRFALRPFAPYGLAEGPLAPVSSRPVVVASLAYVGFNLLPAIGLGGMPGGGLQIAWEAHVGGYLFGLFAFPVFDRMARRGRAGAASLV